jgi:hypothetical protein
MKPLRPPAAGRRGSALIITISMLVLLTVAAVAFFSRATSQRTIENSRANQILAEQLAKTGADYDLGLLLAEIAAGSTASTNNGTVVYRPTAATNAVPRRALAQSTMAADPHFANLLRQSTNGGHNTAAPSQNGRAVGPARWNAPFLLTGGGFTSTNQLAQWIYVLRDGTVAGAPSTNAVGRFACHVYDIGGLLDANATGYPDSIAPGTTNLAALKGTPAGADLSVIPGVTSANAFVRWRNTNSAGSAAGYLGAVTNAAAAGFLRPAAGDQRLQSRRDLIAMARDAGSGLTTNALPYFTAFSRALDAPCHSPAAGRPKVQDNKLATYGQEDAFNPSLVDTRVTRAFTRADGTPARPGEPLLASRFPLERLALLPAAPDAVGASSDLHRFFGLTRSSGSAPWVYDHGAGDRILRLEEVAAAGREPDFFELLQAAISVGSLAQSGGDNYSSRPVGGAERNLYYHIIQLGANIIDQWDSDSFPARIEFNGVEFSGVEDLPYLARVWDRYYRFRAPNTNNIGFWFRPELWNPHRPTPSAARPASFRFVAEGAWAFSIGHAAPLTGAPMRTYSPVKYFSTGDPGIVFTTNANNGGFRNPGLLKPGAGGATASGNDNVPDPAFPARSFVGLHAGTINAPTNTAGGEGYGGWGFAQPEISFYLQYRSPDGDWVTYDRLEDIVQTCGSGPGNSGPGVHLDVISLAKADARSQRFGAAVVIEGAGEQKQTDNQPETTPRRNFNREGWGLVGRQSVGFVTLPFGQNNPSWSWPPPASPDLYLFAGMEENAASGAGVRLADPDGVVRAADAAYASEASGRMLDTQNGAAGTNSRPLILNRPFRSVADLGYAFRDLPYKTIDFFTDKSGDAALLDVFTIRAAPPLVAGKVNLNTRRPEVLAAVLAGAPADELNPAATLTATNASAVAGRLTNVTSTNPLSSLAGIASNFLPAIAAGDLGAAENAAVKYRRESVARALAAAGDVRTWTVLIDVIAQSGRFAGGTAPANFVVEGEARLWVSTAIDRYLGRAVAAQSEVIDE